MITASFTRNETGLRLALSGHAIYCESGDDIVCAAVSGIFYALCGYLANTHKEGLIIHSIRPGCGDVECDASGEEAMRFACIGLLQIALTYPENLAVINSAFNWKIKQGVA